MYLTVLWDKYEQPNNQMENPGCESPSECVYLESGVCCPCQVRAHEALWEGAGWRERACYEGAEDGLSVTLKVLEDKSPCPLKGTKCDRPAQ